MLDARSRVVFRDATAADDATWACARGWALWKALITLTAVDARQADAAVATRTLAALGVAALGVAEWSHPDP